MASLDSLFDPQDQICYVQCGYCGTVLLVNVPCNNLSMVVTVRCGHCTGILTVNMAKACFVPNQQFLPSLNLQQQDLPPKQDVSSIEVVADKKVVTKRGPPSFCFSSDDEDYEDSVSVDQAIHKPPEKKQRAPSAYNNFIKDEIKRLKVEYPNMTHKQAFSAAAKNWAYYPQNIYKGAEVQGVGDRDGNMPTCSYADHQQWFP